MANRSVQKNGRGRRARSLGALLLSTAIAGCSIAEVPIYANSPNFEVQERWAAHLAQNPGMVDNGWIHSFRDPRLVELVNEALANNHDLAVAAARLEEFRVRAVRAGAPLVPQLDLRGQARDSDNFDDGSASLDSGSLGLELSWEIDVWGRIRNDQAAAALDAVAESAAFEAARFSLAAAVADAWFVINGNAEILAVNRSELRVERNALRLVQERVDAGQVLSVDANIQRANVASAEDRVFQAEGNFLESIRSLEVLLGRYPSADLKSSGFLGGLPGAVKTGVPAALLERRPDVVAADRRVAAAFFRTEAAKAARLPQFTIAADVTGNGQSFSDIFEDGNIIWTLVGNVIAPIIDGKQRESDVKIATAQQQQALESYASTALTAFQEVENALTNEAVLARRAAALTTVVSQQRQALDIEQQRYDAGEIEIDRVDDARLRFFTARRDLVSVRVAQLRQRVQLYLALGGSFESTDVVTAAGG